ncbi:hypothetical protein FQR65_LT07578 [Abscondita terminalis]|nr:hypothetical protein FQR65_LT07578 [Abscondita terminalis]
MDLLETILRSANAEKYVELFAKNGIEAATLPLLSIEDLKFLGVDEKDVRIEILNKASHLQIPHEKLISIVLTKEDVELILNQITYQLNLHHALLSCPIIRKDVVVCDVKLGNATKCLLNCLESLSNKLDEFEQRILFISGLSCVIGLERTFRFFFQRHKVKASIAFFGGIVIVLVGWPLVGMLLETYGFVLLFSGFFPVAINFLRRVPVLGTLLNMPGISMLVDKLAGDSNRTTV